MAHRHVILGASLAGATAAITLRDEGADGEVILIGAEPQPPYERPPLSKAYLRGEVPFDKALVRPAAFYAEHSDPNHVRDARDASRSGSARRGA